MGLITSTRNIMFRDFIILNIVLVFTTSVNGSYNVTNSTRRQNSGIEKYLNKCCPFGKNVGFAKLCVNHTLTLNTSDIKVYNEYINLSGKSFEDLFTLIPNKFDDKTFKIEVIDIIWLGHIVYLTESGVIQLELPNANPRWRTIPKNGYCIDIDHRNGKQPRFWAILPDENTGRVNGSYNVTNSPRRQNSGIEKYLNKCCPFGQNVGLRKLCVNHNFTLNTSDIKVYDEYINLSGKSFEDLFTLIPNKFENKTFKIEVIDIIWLGHIVYLTESGVIQLELPNAYGRWRTIPNNSYCIDIDHRNGKQPRFWAILPDENTPPRSKFDNTYLTVATILSCFFMLLVLIVYTLLPELRNFNGLILMAYVFSLLMAFSLLAVVQIYNFYNELCIYLASGMYFFFLAAFCWMSVMSYDMWWTLRSRLKQHRPRHGHHMKFLMYCLCAWGVPFLLTIGLVVVNSFKDEMKRYPWFVTPGIPDKGCFLQGGEKLLYFYIPMLILIISNWMFYTLTAFNIWLVNQGTAMLDSSAGGNKQAHRAQTQRFMLYLKLSVVMGLSWLLEIISLMAPGLSVWFVTDTYNSLIGLAMFLIFVCKRHIWRKLCKRCGHQKNRWSSKTQSRAESNQENIALKSVVNPQPNGLNG